MALELNEDQLQIQDLVRRVAREKVAARAQEIDLTAEYPHDMFELVKELGLFTLPFPPEYGGTGSMLSACVAVEELGRVCYNTAYLLVVQWVPIGAILAGGSPEQKQKYLPGLASGDLRGALSLTEPQSGSDVAGIKTRARRDGNGFRLNGSKIWCTNAGMADFVLVAAKTGEDDERGKINLFIVDKGTPGFVVGRKEDKIGARGVPSHSLFFDNAYVPAENMLGDEQTGFRVAMAALNDSRPIIGARGVGLAQGALDHAIEFIKSRRAFGQAVSDFQGVRWMVADMAIQIEASRRLVYQAAAAVDAGIKGKELAQLAAIAKCHATDTAMSVATDAVQLFGAAGISNEYPINRYFRDAKVLQIIEGTNQIQRNIISRNLLD
ncbi:acyl-CoA dehydrogenase family protein [Rhizobium sp. C4]|uniref:acyl-CoA dehydrogenase family protein n=1 Tax=Rhizobium sp. C4 TaxID=1349800 RepID=UPI001E327EAE|nr:acyl-CoA dehydrogenase family protein [Rhizobium sp. C4]MCD2172255.1 acyl-CoA dehydrogenase family protein [Rhizobium sp. C4]